MKWLTTKSIFRCITSIAKLSLLAFQWRVLEEAMDENNPLLERFRFSVYCRSNLEEFFMVRVAV